MKKLKKDKLDIKLRTNHEMPELYSKCEGCFNSNCEDCDEWENDELLLSLNHDYCYLEGRHPSTNDEDWELYLRGINEDYSEELYYTLKTRLEEREK